MMLNKLCNHYIIHQLYKVQYIIHVCVHIIWYIWYTKNDGVQIQHNVMVHITQYRVFYMSYVTKIIFSIFALSLSVSGGVSEQLPAHPQLLQEDSLLPLASDAHLPQYAASVCISV